MGSAQLSIHTFTSANSKWKALKVAGYSSNYNLIIKNNEPDITRKI